MSSVSIDRLNPLTNPGEWIWLGTGMVKASLIDRIFVQRTTDLFTKKVIEQTMVCTKSGPPVWLRGDLRNVVLVAMETPVKDHLISHLMVTAGCERLERLQVFPYWDFDAADWKDVTCDAE